MTPIVSPQESDEVLSWAVRAQWWTEATEKNTEETKPSSQTPYTVRETNLSRRQRVLRSSPVTSVFFRTRATADVAAGSQRTVAAGGRERSFTNPLAAGGG